MVDNMKILKNPPIKEVVVGVLCEDLFKSFDEINLFFEQSLLKDKYAQKEVINSMALSIDEEPKLGQRATVGIVCLANNENSKIHIELDKLMFFDSHKYDKFETFYDRFKIILSEILKYKDNNLKINNIGLRYVNNFVLSNENLNKKFLVKQSIETRDDEIFAFPLNSLFLMNIKSSKNPNMYAIVKTIKEAHNPVSTRVVFDIDSHLDGTYNIANEIDLKEKLLELKIFKNKIFFSNFNDVYSIKEFM